MSAVFLFARPWVLLLLLGVAALAVWRVWRDRRRAAVAWSVAERALGAVPVTWRVRARWVPTALMLLALALLVVALARPQEGRRQTTIDSEGIAIALLVDRSSSMRALDFELEGQRVDRLAAVKRVAADFLLGDADLALAGRGADLVGLITFAQYADVISTLTLDHSFVVDGLESARIVERGSEDGTAIGDAVGLAVERLQSLEQPVQSRVIILLTDGENTAGSLDPLQAAELAASQGVKIYTIGVGTRGRAPVPVRGVFGQTRIRMAQVNIDEATLTAMADATGGAYFRATDTASLAGVYRAIDELETTVLEERTVTDTRELAVDAWRDALPLGWSLPPLLPLAAGALAAGVLVNLLVYRRV